jgi:cob(I)alamin adenosyltransferase
MKIYTKTGDKGTTSLVGGERTPKNDIRLDCYGTVDELIAYTGFLRDHEECRKYHDFLLQIQDDLMVCASILATDIDNKTAKIPKLYENRIVELEKEMDNMEKGLPEINGFILPGGNKAVSVCHVVRTVTRRAERLTVSLEQKSDSINLVLRYLNRLSDYFFMLGRRISADLNIKETLWQPKLH